MKVDFNRLKDIYGNSILINYKDNLDEVVENIKYLERLEFNNIYEIIEYNPYIFTKSNDIFKDKINNLINNLGVEYIEKLNEDISLWDKLNEE